MKLFSTLLLALIMNSFLLSCRSTPQVSSEKLSGVFLNQSLLDNLSSDSYHEIPFYCSQIVFDTSSTAYINTGIEMFGLKIKQLDHTMWLQSAYKVNNQMQDVEIKIVDSQHLLLMDTSYTNLKSPTTFSKFLSVIDPEKTFEFYLNKSSISAKYHNIDHPGEEGSYIKFTNEGRIYGWDTYERYRLCYAGDCLAESSVTAKIILLEKDENSFDFFTWEMRNDTLTLNKLEEPHPDIKGERKISGEKVRFIKIPD